MAGIEQARKARATPIAKERASTGLGIAMILGAVFLLSLSDGLVKLSSEGLAIGQLFAVRSVLAALLIGVIARAFSRKAELRLERARWVLARSLLLTGMWIAYYVALPSMSFALAAAALYTAPLFMAVFARILLKEGIGSRRWLAIGIGLVGVGLVLRPDARALSPVAALPFLAGAFYALAAIVTWSRCSREKPLAMALNLNLCLGLAGAVAVAALHAFPPPDRSVEARPFILTAWPPLDASEWLLLAMLALFMVVIATAVAKAYQTAPSAIIGMFDNGYLVFATIWSALLFDETPDAITAIGIALIGGGAVMAARAPSPRAGG